MSNITKPAETGAIRAEKSFSSRQVESGRIRSPGWRYLSSNAGVTLVGTARGCRTTSHHVGIRIRHTYLVDVVYGAYRGYLLTYIIFLVLSCISRKLKMVVPVKAYVET